MKLTDNKPPATLGELLMLALDDVGQLDRDKYIPDHGMWHGRLGKPKCRICLAGAVIAATMQAPPNEHLTPDDYPLGWSDALSALDCARCGRLAEAWDMIQPAQLPQPSTSIQRSVRDPLVGVTYPAIPQALLVMEFELQTDLIGMKLLELNTWEDMDALVGILRPVAEQLLEKGL